MPFLIKDEVTLRFRSRPHGMQKHPVGKNVAKNANRNYTGTG